MIDVPLLFCVICREPVPAERVVRGANTCDKKHAQMKKKMMRDFKASKVCQTCGRPARKRRESSNVSLVPSQHSEVTVLGADAKAEVMAAVVKAVTPPSTPEKEAYMEAIRG